MGQWWKPYEAILEEKPKEVKVVLLTAIAKELVEFCEAFPPSQDDISFLSMSQEIRFKDKLEHMPQITPVFLRTCCHLLRLELNFDIDAIDHFFRNALYKDACSTELHLEALHFLRPVLLEMLFQRKEDCKGNLKNKDLINIVDQLEERYIRKHSAIISL